ncbi:hypothetical protein H0W91_01610 [Patescibacteria group bacterium]|nr:hypothetical protein [Patescibacteria group bacterium]
MFDPLVQSFSGSNMQLILKILYYSSFLFVPLFLAYLAWEFWVEYVQGYFFASQTYVLLEVKLPREIFKSPQAAEFFIAGLSQGFGEGNWYEKYWKGGVRPWFSLEIVSIDGGVHFFIWTRKGFKNAIEANIYSQYPGIEIYEVPDYALPMTYDPEVNAIWASEFDLTKPDSYPIKTYIDYELEKNPKEEYKIDPMTPLIEFLGGLGKGNQVGMQILVRSHKAEDKDPTTGKMVDKRWKDSAQEEITKIIKGTKGEVGEDGKPIPGTNRQLTDVERETINALNRSTSKAGFDVGIRVVYVAPKEVFSPANIGGIIGGLTHFNSSLNGFKPARGSTEKYGHFLLAWKTRSEKTRNAEKRYLLDAYKRRAYFHKPYKSPHFVLNTEELATLYHFPGIVSATPTFSRIESRKSEAPANLPI